MEKVIAETRGNRSEKEMVKTVQQMLKLIEFTQEHLTSNDSVTSITIKNETHTLTITPNGK